MVFITPFANAQYITHAPHNLYTAFQEPRKNYKKEHTYTHTEHNYKMNSRWKQGTIGIGAKRRTCSQRFRRYHNQQAFFPTFCSSLYRQGSFPLTYIERTLYIHVDQIKPING